MLCVWVNLKILTCVECFKEIQKYIKKPFPLTRKEVRVYTCIFDKSFIEERRYPEQKVKEEISSNHCSLPLMFYSKANIQLRMFQTVLY